MDSSYHIGTIVPIKIFIADIQCLVEIFELLLQMLIVVKLVINTIKWFSPTEPRVSNKPSYIFISTKQLEKCQQIIGFKIERIAQFQN